MPILTVFDNPFVLVSSGAAAISSLVALYTLHLNRRKFPIETVALTAESDAARAAKATDILQAVNLMLGLINTLKQGLEKDLEEAASRQNVQIRVWFDAIEARLDSVEAAIKQLT